MCIIFSIIAQMSSVFETSVQLQGVRTPIAREKMFSLINDWQIEICNALKTSFVLKCLLNLSYKVLRVLKYYNKYPRMH